MPKTKADLRRTALHNRTLLSDEDLARIDELLCPLLLDAVRDASCIAAYISYGSEPGTVSFLNAVHQAGISLLLPVLSSFPDVQWTLTDDWTQSTTLNPALPPEPNSEPLPPEALSQADVIVIPALSIDRHGNRLGRGAGWYDRALEHRREDAKIVAVVHEGEILDSIPHDSFDVPVQAIVTVNGWTQID